ncbi:MAG: hypothetical protein M3R55_04260 [Acidobacteriota bacterium]|nr:hypothetical protein [Acidobacteriota bacterium]
MGARAADELALAFYSRGSRLTAGMVREKMAALGLASEFAAGYEGLLRGVTAEAVYGSSVGVRSTPALFVNGRRLLSSDHLARALEIERDRVMSDGTAASAFTTR